MGIITDKQMSSKAVSRDLWLTEDAPRGAGRFVARITRSGERLFYFRYTAPNGDRDWLIVGQYDPTGRAGLTLAEARKKAGEYSKLYQGGAKDLRVYFENLAKEAAERKATEEALREAERLAAEASAAKQAARLTIRELFCRWETLELRTRKDKGAEIRRTFEKDVFPTLGEVAAEDVKRSMVAACLDSIVERNAPIIARNMLGDLRQMFGFAIKREYVENDPTSHLKRDDFGKKVERERVLDEVEIKLLHKMLSAADMQEASIAACWIMLSTCCRVGEISQAQWAHIDLEAGTWRIPSDNAKNGKEHTVYLSSFAISHFQTLKHLVESAAKGKTGKVAPETSPWVLPASHRDGHVCVKSLAKQIGDRQRGIKEPMKNRTRLTTSLELPRGKWTPHDLRRTGATLMGALGVRPDVIEKCLNHVEQNRLVRIYQRQTLVAEQAEAWRILGERLELLTREGADNLIIFSGQSDKVAA